MKAFSFALSALAFLTSGYFFVSEFRVTGESNHVIYMGMLFTLMIICVLGLIINIPDFMKAKRRVRGFSYNSYSPQRIRNKSFDSQLGLM
ncbi:MAG: hypothetical protein EOO01_27290 [Chitinophagaceae bacterium]|nr:MAG: hypothetical protein EOO01_27290 [Chitinophagaceae bacterium]